MTNTTTQVPNQPAQAIMPRGAAFERSVAARFTHKETGIFWYVSTDGHPEAPHVLHIFERGGKMPLASRRYRTRADRAARVAQYITRCTTKSAAAISDKPSPSDVLMAQPTAAKSSPRVNK